ncbi:unnamed protein product [Cercopithifilaria johnstoni]|uniref:Uncharacterized protein n=1 Tax=Cercopithifilaria johnstoni TaxID=2874296 RepID=A0A8J2MUM5_9BILA|nr:unnamed protein product [Cercopithifilaria johnstoni]
MFNFSDQSADTQQWQYSKYKTTLSNQQSNPVVIQTPSTGTHVELADSFSKSSQTDYFRDTNSCSNCSNLLICAAEFLTKIELNYGRPTTVSSNLSTSSQYTQSIKQSPKNTGGLARSSIRFSFSLFLFLLLFCSFPYCSSSTPF